MDPQRADNCMLAGQRALVTGAHTGIGAAIAYTLASVSAAVVVNYTRCSQDPGEGHLTRHDQDHLQSHGLG
jgi:NAD(P)-dependent dehydrogenase (short-subunit alcohol dehydrogenase family)